MSFGVVASIVILALAALAAATKTIGASGIVAGVLLAHVMTWTGTPGPLAVFALFVIVGTVSSRFGREKKIRLGVMQAEEGRRNWTHAVANCGPSALVIVLWQIAGGSPDVATSTIAAAGLGGMLADTAASEWGTWLGGPPRHILTLRVVKTGTDGAISLAGTIAAAAASVAAAVVFCLSEGAPVSHGRIVVLAAFVGNLADSVLGATVEPMLGRHGGAVVNALAASTSMTVAWAVLGSP